MISFKNKLITIFLCVLMLVMPAFSVVSSAAAMPLQDYVAKYTAFIHDGMHDNGLFWPDYQTPKLSPYTAYGCCAYVCDYTYYMFGIKGPRSNDSYSGSANQIRTGDVVHITNNYGEHWFIVLARNGNKLYTAEGCYASYNYVSDSRYWIDGDTLMHYHTKNNVIVDAYHFNIDTGGLSVINDPVVLNFSTSGASSVASRTYQRGSNVDLTPFKSSSKCKAFDGWYLDAAYTKPVTKVTLKADDTTVYAKYKENHDYTDKVVKYPNLTEEGKVLHQCTVCGASYVSNTPKIDLLKDDISALFFDVPKESWYHDAVAVAVKENLFAGTSANSFTPDGKMTRAMLVAVLYRMSGNKAKYLNLFNDVKDGMWYTDACSWAYATGITAGVGNDCFAPNAPVTREQTAVLLKRYTEISGNDTFTDPDLVGFEDSDSVSDFALDGVSWAVTNGFLSGASVKGDLWLWPKEDTTRAQLASIMVRYIEKNR